MTKSRRRDMSEWSSPGMSAEELDEMFRIDSFCRRVGRSYQVVTEAMSGAELSFRRFKDELSKPVGGESDES